MKALLSLLFVAVATRFRSWAALEAEVVARRHQLLVLHRRHRARPRLTVIDRLIRIWLYRVAPGCLNTLVIVKPETVVRWHRAGFRAW